MKNKLFLFTLWLGLSSQTMAQPGTLDLTFGNNGKVTTNAGQGNEFARAIAIQPDGKVVVAGDSWINSTVLEDFALARYHSDGSLDVTFGNNGLVITDIQQNSDGAKAIAIQPDGKIVVAGHADNGANYDFAVVRYLSDGTLDNSFGANGKVIKNFGSTDFGLALALLPNGKILVSGRVYNGSTGDFGLLQLNSNGTPDNSFGNGGMVKSDLFGEEESANALAIQPDGKIVVVGDRYTNNTSIFAVARYHPDGSLDPSFSFDGKLSTSIGNMSDVAYAVAIQSDGKIVVAGQSNTSTISDFALARYLSDGTPDPSFSADGQLTTSISNGGDYAFALALQTDGKIVAAGRAAGTSSNSDFALVRYLPDGSPDATFGANGTALADFSGGTDLGYAMASYQNNWVVAGYTDNNSTSQFAIARFLGGSSVGTGDPTNLASSIVRLFPNPGQELVTLELPLEDMGNPRIQLYDLMGNLVQHNWQPVLKLNGLQQMEIQMPASLPCGVYLIRLLTSKGNIGVKWTKL